MGPRWFVAGVAGVLSLSGLVLTPSATSAEQATVVSIDAPSNVTSGTNFTVTVDVSQVTDFDSASYDVVFDNAVLMLVSVANGSIGGTTIPVTNSPGSASPSRVVQNVPGLSGVTGSGTLITITFNATGADGTSSDIELTSLVLGDNSAQLIQTTFQSDTVVVGTPATATPTPVPTGTATSAEQATVVSIDAPSNVTSGANFAATVDVSQVTDFDSASYRVVFDSNGLTIVSIAAGSIGGAEIPIIGTPSGSSPVTVAQNVPGTAGVTGSGSLITITFNVIGADGAESDIELTSLVLGDNTAQQIQTTLQSDSVTVVAAATPTPVPTSTATSAEQATVVSIDAPSNVTSGANFTATVDVSQVTDFDSASYHVVFDSGSIGGAEIPIIGTPSGSSPVTVAQNVPGTAGVTGSGSLITITFNVIGADGAESDIELTSLVLGDNTAQQIQTTLQSDSVTVVAAATPTPVPTSTATSAEQATVVSVDAPSNVTSGANFTVTVDVSQVTDFDSASYDVVFDNAVLMLVSVANGSIGGTTIPVTNSPGSASPSRVVQNVPGLSGVTGSGTLITITFNATGADGTSSDIELTSLVLGDNSAQLIQTTFQSDTVVVGTPATATPTPVPTGTVTPTAIPSLNLWGLRAMGVSITALFVWRIRRRSAA